METKNIVALVVVAVVVVAVVALALFASVFTLVPGPGSSSSSNAGRVVFTVADAAADMGTVTSVKVTVDRLEVQNAANWGTSVSGFHLISSTPHTYDLLQLKASGSQSLLADANLGAGSYGLVRMHISKVMITDSSGEHEATLPSGDLKIVGGFDVKPNSTTAVTFDFLADKSVHVTGNGKYILAPVVRMIGYEDADVDASSKEDVKVVGGRIKIDTEIGMDERGDVGVGKRIANNADLTIDGDRIVVRGTSAAQVPGIVSVGETILTGNGPGNENGIDLDGCIAIAEQQERFSCIAQWCGSEARDFNRCYSLADENDKLGCLNKCNPNSNT